MELTDLGPRWARPLAIAAALLIMFVIMRSSPTPTYTAPPNALAGAPAPPLALQGEFVAAPSAPPPVIAPQPMDGRIAVVEDGPLALYTTDGSYSSDQVRAMAEPLAEALRYVSERTAMQLSAPVSIIFDRRANCGFDGAAYTERRTIILYACPDMPARRSINILAHEFVHQLAYDRYGGAHMQADLVLSEGLATWGAGRYWLGNESDFRGFVRNNYAANLLPLGSHYRDYGTIDAMNRLYYQWASLVDFVITTRGRDTFDRLYASGRGMQPNTADYNRILGTDLAGLEGEWKEWLSQ
jgi:hypothetical protein